MRTQAIRAATAALLGVVLLGTAACSGEQLGEQSGPIDAGQGTEEGGTQTEEGGSQTEPAGAPGEDSTTDSPDASAEASDGPATRPLTSPDKAVGTRAHPLSAGSEVTDGDWTVALGQARDGWEEIHAAEPYNEPPEEGFEYWLVPVTATYAGEGSASPWLDLQFAFVSEDGRSYGDWCPAIVPDDLMEVDDLYTDATVEANVCLRVPADTEGLWTVTTYWGDPVFFSAERD